MQFGLLLSIKWQIAFCDRQEAEKVYCNPSLDGIRTEWAR